MGSKLLFDEGKINQKEKEYMHYAVNPEIRALMEKHAKYLITVLGIFGKCNFIVSDFLVLHKP